MGKKSHLTEFERFIAQLGHLIAVRKELDDTLQKIRSKETDTMFGSQVGKRARVSWKRVLDGSDMTVDGIVDGYANGILQVDGYNVDITRLTEFVPLDCEMT